VDVARGKEKTPKALGPATVAKPAVIGALALLVVDTVLRHVL
jgi:hypothetical protein